MARSRWFCFVSVLLDNLDLTKIDIEKGHVQEGLHVLFIFINM
jgi:hypothetical protein